MRKIASFILLLILIFTTGCSGFSSPKIEDYTWEMSSVAYVEDEQLVMVAVGESDPVYPEAKVIDMILTASSGKITITDKTNNKTYEGTYEVESKNHESTIYKITLDGKDGYATVAMTTYADDSETPTLPINLGDYSMYFYAN